MTEYRLISEAPADVDVEAAFEWYENERQALGLEFLDELRAAYNRIAGGPLKYQELRGGIRRALLRRFRTQSTLPSKAISLSWLQCCMPVAIQQSGSVSEANAPPDPTAGMRFVLDSEDPFTRRGSAARRSAR